MNAPAHITLPRRIHLPTTPSLTYAASHTTDDDWNKSNFYTYHSKIRRSAVRDKVTPNCDWCNFGEM